MEGGLLKGLGVSAAPARSVLWDIIYLIKSYLRVFGKNEGSKDTEFTTLPYSTCYKFGD